MIIAHLVFMMKFGGIESMLVNIANIQQKSGHDVHLFIINDGEEPSLISALDKQITIHRIERPIGSKSPFYPLKLSFKLRRLRPDIVHIHTSSIYRHIALAFMSDRICFTFHSMKFVDGKIPGFLKKFKRLFSISQSVHDSLKKLTSLESTIVYNGIVSSKFKSESERSDRSIFKIIQTGRLIIETKGQDILLRATKILVDRGYKDFEVYFVGDGPSKEYLQNLADELGLSEIVTFMGTKTQEYIQNNLCDYDLFVMPSRFEGFGLTVAEAMAAKLPVIVSKCDGLLEVVDNGKAGYIFEKGEACDLADKIELFLRKENNPDMIQIAYNRVRKEFDVENTAKRYIEEYRKMLDE